MLNMYNSDLFFLRTDVLADKTHNNRGDQLTVKSLRRRAADAPRTEIPLNRLRRKRHVSFLHLPAQQDRKAHVGDSLTSTINRNQPTSSFITRQNTIATSQPHVPNVVVEYILRSLAQLLYKDLSDAATVWRFVLFPLNEL